MAAYRRFVSYMYDYAQGKKNNNCGFVRLESRDGRCRIYMNINGRSKTVVTYKVYLLMRENDGYHAILLAEISAEQHVVMNVQTEEKNLMGTSYELHQMTGMVILGSDQTIYGTRWDDEPLDTTLLENIWPMGEALYWFGHHEKKKVEKPVMVKEELPVLHEEESDLPPSPFELAMSQLPQMYPFDDESIEKCVRMELRDLSILPVQCWVYGGNSFLLHSYYSYRHLILARMEENSDNDRRKYLLGVPGIYHPRERYMATMFGFEVFRPVSQLHQGKGAFGYWLTELK